MANGEVVVGVDVSLAQLDVAQWPSGESFSVGNDAAGVAELLARCAQWHPQAVVVEARGGAGRSAGRGVVRGAGCGGGG